METKSRTKVFQYFLLTSAILLVTTAWGEVDVKIDSSGKESDPSVSIVPVVDQSGNQEEEQIGSVDELQIRGVAPQEDSGINSDDQSSSSSAPRNAVIDTPVHPSDPPDGHDSNTKESSDPPDGYESNTKESSDPPDGHDSNTKESVAIETDEKKSGIDDQTGNDAVSKETPTDTDSDKRAHVTNTTFADHPSDNLTGRNENVPSIDLTRVTSDSPSTESAANVRNKLEGTNNPQTSVSSESVSLVDDEVPSVPPSPSSPPSVPPSSPPSQLSSLSLEDHSATPIEVTEIKHSYSGSEGTDLIGSTDSPSPQSTESPPSDTSASLPSDTSASPPLNGDSTASETLHDGESASHLDVSSTEISSFQTPHGITEEIPDDGSKGTTTSPSTTLLPVSNVMLKPVIKARSEIPEMHLRDLVFLVIKSKDFDIFDWVDSKDGSLRAFVASKLREEIPNHSFTANDVMYIENSPRIELDALLMEMGIIDHEYKHGLHLYPGEEVVKVLSSPNVTMEMKEKLSIEVLSITTDEGKAKRVFQSIEAEISMSTIIGRSDVVLVILILTFISCVLVISILIGYFCCRRKGNKISFGNFSSNNNSTSSSVQPPTNMTSPQEFNLRTLDRVPPLYTCYDLNPAAEILREEKCSSINKSGSNLSINVLPINGNSVTLLQHHYPQVQLGRRSSSHTGLHRIHVNEGWIQVLPANTTVQKDVRKYSNLDHSPSSSTCSSSTCNHEANVESCTCEDTVMNVHIRHQSTFPIPKSSNLEGNNPRNSNQMTSFAHGLMKDTKL